MRVKDENELAKLGLRLDPADPTKAIPLDGPAATVPPAMSASASRAVPIGQTGGGQQTNVSDGPIALSFFSGAMGWDLGLEAAGFAVHLAVEIDEDARATIRANRPHLPVLDDILDCTAAKVREEAGIGDRDIVVVAGGPPCQSYSLAGNRQGLDDPRGGLLPTFVDLALDLRPRYVVVENVRGLLLDRAFDAVLGRFRDGGYVVSWNLYNSADFGAAQCRERVIIVASRSGRVPYLAPTNSDRPEDGLPPWRTLRDAIGDMAGVEHHGARYSRKRLELWRLLRAGQDGRHLRDLVQAEDEAIGRNACYYKRLAWDKPAPTLVTKPGSFLSGCCHPEEDRPLSVPEYKRVQGFSDEWVVCGSITSQYKQLGNAVPVPLGQAIGLTLREHMRSGNSEDPVPGFKYSRPDSMGDRDRGGDAAEARIAEVARESAAETDPDAVATINANRPGLPVLGDIQACADPTSVVAATADQIPDVGDLTRLSDAELWARIEAEGSNIRQIEKEIADRDGYLTAARYRRGLLLLELKRRCVHGDFEAECKSRKVKSQRASEDMRIAEYFPNEEEAGKVSVRRALAIVKTRPAGGGSDRRPVSPTDAASVRPEEGWADRDFDGDEETVGNAREYDDPDEDGADSDQDASPDVSVEESLPHATDAELEAAAVFVEQVGGLPNAARALAMKGVRAGDKDMLKDALKEMLRGAQVTLSTAEISEIVVCLCVTKKGFKAIVP